MTKTDKQTREKKNLGKSKVILVLLALYIIVSFVCLAWLFLRYQESKKFDGVISLAESYYENDLYSVITWGMEDSEKKAYLKENSGTGFNMTVNSLLSISSDSSVSIKADLEKAGCDLDKSMVYLFPEEPFTAADVKIVVRDYCSIED